MADNEATRLVIFEQEKIKETLSTEGSRILAARLRIVAKATFRKELKADPFTSPGEIIKARQLRYVIKTLLPQIIEGLVNYDPDAPDEQVVPKDRFKVDDWQKKIADKSTSKPKTRKGGKEK